MTTTLQASAPVVTAATPSGSIAALIERFEDYIVGNRGSVESRCRTSTALQQIVDMGPRALNEIGSHLEASQEVTNYGGYPSRRELNEAWVRLLTMMDEKHRLGFRPSWGQNITVWISWARCRAS